MADAQPRLNILHVFRAPVGGLFRHVVDLARGQAARGHRVTVLTEFPNHPHGVIPVQYRGRVLARESMDGFTVGEGSGDKGDANAAAHLSHEIVET